MAQRSGARRAEEPEHETSLLDVPLLSVAGVGKTFGSTVVLQDISFTLAAGSILGVVGENGAGKSTLMKILGGVYPAGTFEGEVWMRGEHVAFRSVTDARRAGMVLIPQELHIAPDLAIAENMFAGALPSRLGMVNSADLIERAVTWLEFFDLNVDPRRPASILSPSEQRLILIAGALSLRARVLILDEPTASLSDGETQILFGHLRRLRDQGIGILFISHRLDDIAAVCDDALVLRNGRMIEHLPASAPRSRLIEAMIGREAGAVTGPIGHRITDRVILDVRSLTVSDPVSPGRLRVDSVSFQVHQGEVLGLFGLVGAGRTEILRSLFGTWPTAPGGTIELAGVPYQPISPRRAIAQGIALLTEDRKQTGIFAGHSLTWNFDAASMRAISTLGFLQTRKDDERARKLMAQTRVRAANVGQQIESLSGGNQQKVLLGRWLAASPRLLLLDEPTLGVDVGAREELYLEIEQIARDGCAVLLVSSDLDEVLRLSDRIHVMYKGRLVSEHSINPTRHELMASATGGTS